ncbi:MAG: hypothetical protein ACUVXD_04685 [Thermodesulfobacteriota bacterium]
MKVDREQGSELIRGIVIPAGWDEHGNVISLAISTPLEEEFVIEDSDKAKELRRHMHEEVEVHAAVVEDAQGNKRIVVKGYRKGGAVEESLTG